MRPSHFRPACLGPIIFSAGPREAAKPPITTTVHRDLSSSSMWQAPAAIPASPMRQPSRRKMRPSHFRPACLGRLFSRRVRARLQNRRSRPPSIGTFHRPACGRLRRPSPYRRCAGHRVRKCGHRISGHLHKECAGPWAQLMYGFFPTGANRMARRTILNHPSISGKNLPAT